MIYAGVEPATRVDGEDQLRQARVLGRVAADTVAIEEQDVNGMDALLVSIEEKSDYAKCLPLADKEAPTTLLAYRRMWPGSVVAKTFPEITATDNGPEFGKEFEAGINAAGGAHQRSVPRRPQSNARIERFIQTLEKGTASLMVQESEPKE